MPNEQPGKPNGGNGYVTTRELYDRIIWLEGKLEPRLRRMEIAVAVLIVTSGAQLTKLLGGPDAPQVAFETASRLFT